NQPPCVQPGSPQQRGPPESEAMKGITRHQLGGNPFMVELADLYGYSPRIAQAIVQVRAGAAEPYYDDILVADAEFSHRLAYAANDADGAQLANEESTASATATQTAPTTGEVPAVTGEQIRKILRNGDVNLYVNGNVIDHFYGLHRAPAGGGPQIQVSMGGTT